MSRAIIGRGTWMDKVAWSLLEREQRLGRDTSMLRTESGLGASGIPHVGSLSDAVRAFGVSMALRDLGYMSEMIAFSDDLDGLRRVPEGLPEWLGEHICRPVSRIPDPFCCHPSYGSHMSSILTDALDSLKVKYTFQSGSEAYRSGLLSSQIRTILENAQRIGKRVEEAVGQRKFRDVLPYYPICQFCGRLYVAECSSYDPSTRKVSYECGGAEVAGRLIKGCGNRGELSVEKGEGKLSWKVEWAARWSALDVRFEAYGKDIADSVKVNDWISEHILGFTPPLHVRYEMFLDKSGRKISKSLGNVFTPQAWMRYGTPQSLLVLMYKRMVGTRSLSVEDIPTYMDEVGQLEELYFSTRKDSGVKVAKLRGLYEYIHNLKPPSKPTSRVPFRMLIELASVAPKERLGEYVVKRLQAYGLLGEPNTGVMEMIRLASNWAEDFKPPSGIRLDLGKDERKALMQLADFLQEGSDSKSIQGAIFEVARSNGLEVASFFRTLYRILLNAEKGPKLGPYIVDIGTERAVALIRSQALSSHQVY